MNFIVKDGPLLSFEDELGLRHGRNAAKVACSIFEKLSIPIPQQRDYLPGKESIHVFLHHQALLLRFGKACSANISDHVLQPFASVALTDDAVIELLPGIKVGGSALDKLRLKFALAFQGNDFPRQEMVRSNIGSLKEGSKVVQRLVLDRGAVQAFTPVFNRSSSVQAPIQAAYFGNLKTQAANLALDRNIPISQAQRDGFFMQCQSHAAMHESEPAKRLHNSWVISGLERKRQSLVLTAAHEYALRY